MRSLDQVRDDMKRSLAILDDQILNARPMIESPLQYLKRVHALAHRLVSETFMVELLELEEEENEYGYEPEQVE